MMHTKGKGQFTLKQLNKFKKWLVKVFTKKQWICQTHNKFATVIDFANGKIYCESCSIVPAHFDVNSK